MRIFLTKQIFPFFLALIISALLLKLSNKSEILIQHNKQVITLKKQAVSNQLFLPNLLTSNDELDFYGSLKNKNQITILGSSELTGNFAYIPHKFLPDTLHIRTVSFGHAYQQHFAIYCQLLAFKKELKDKNICVIISPGWFEQGGTNIEAFLEFVRPNFLKRIIKDKSICLEDKLYIGEFIHMNYKNIENPSSEITYFDNLFNYHTIPLLSEYFWNKNSEFETINYHINQTQHTPIPKAKFDFKSSLNSEIKAFKSNVKSNPFFINDDYFNTYIKLKDGNLLKGEFAEISIANNRELKDFDKLIKLFKEKHVKASFIIQALNPYHYKRLDRFTPFVSHIINRLKKSDFPFLNLFTSTKEDYLPGTLNDIMHLGNVGWLLMNQFIVETYTK